MSGPQIPVPTGRELFSWANLMVSYLREQQRSDRGASSVHLEHQVAGKLPSAAKDGTLMYDPVYGTPVYSEGGVWYSLGIASKKLLEITLTSETNVDLNIAGNNALLVGRGITCSVSSTRNVLFSSDGGATFHSTSGDYQSIAATGVETNTAAIVPQTPAVATAASFALFLYNLKQGQPMYYAPNIPLTGIFDGVSDPIDAIRMVPSAGGTFTGGTLKVYGL